MKKIAFVLGNISLGAGTERAVTNLANAFSRDENNQVFIVSINSEDKDKPYYPLEKGIKVIHMNAGKGFLDPIDLLQNIIKSLFFRPADIDDHIDLIRTIFYSLRCFHRFDRCGLVPIGETDDCANWKFAINKFRRLFHKRRWDTYRCHFIFHAFYA